MIDKQAVRIRHLIEVIGKRVMTRQGIMAELDLSQDGRRNFRVNYIAPAMKQGFVQMTNPDVPSSPTQAYRLTCKGLEALDLFNPKPQE